MTTPWRVAIVGSGNWGSAIARIVGTNALKNPQLFSENVRMWCYEEDFKGEKLTTQINREHENVKYLPGIKLPPNVIADPDLLSTVKDADALVFVTPHQFIEGICDRLKGHIKSTARAISLVKGIEVHKDKITLIPDAIEEVLGIHCGALSGANIADEVARDKFSETTIGCRVAADGEIWKTLFETPHFRVGLTTDVHGVSLCGALKNVVAVAAGLIDGLAYGNNTKAAIMRIGLMEMKRFSMEFFDDVLPETFLQESAGVADLITSCLGGRNRKCAEAFVRTGKPFDELEAEMLNGQKLQGVQTAQELYEFLSARNITHEYPLFTTVYRIAYEGVQPDRITYHL